MVTKMANQNEKEKFNIPEKKTIEVEKESLEKREIGLTEKKEIFPEDRIVLAELRRELEMMELDEKTKAQAEKIKQKIEFLGEKEKIEHLLDIAREKGLVFAIQVAKRMNEPYILDTLHDILAREGYYQKFIK